MSSVIIVDNMVYNKNFDEIIEDLEKNLQSFPIFHK